MTGNQLASRLLPPGTDLRRAFAAALVEHIDAGWEVGEFSSKTTVFFCDRDGQRRQVAIVNVEPGEHAGYGGAHLISSPYKSD
jgi:hypothetical protein